MKIQIASRPKDPMQFHKTRRHHHEVRHHVVLPQEVPEGSDQFGTWTRGYLEAPQTGRYTFLLASDDGSELWLSN